MMLPEYIPIPTSIVISDRTALIAHYARLRSLAWSNSFDHTDPMPEDQLYGWLGVERRQFYNLVLEMKKIGWILLERLDRTRVRVFFPVQKIAPNDQLVKLVSFNIEETTKLSLTNLDSSAINCTPVQLIASADFIALDSLLATGVHPSIARALADEHTPEYIKYKIDIYEWALKHKIAQGPGYLVGSIRHRWDPPPGYNSNGGPPRAKRPIIIQQEEMDLDNDPEPEAVDPVTPAQLQEKVSGTDFTPAEVWEKICQGLNNGIFFKHHQYQQYFSDTHVLDFRDPLMIIHVPDEKVEMFLTHRALRTIQQVSVGVCRRPLEFQFVADIKSTSQPEEIKC